MISFHGSKAFIYAGILIFVSASSLFAAILKAKVERIKVKEKELLIVSEQLEASNAEIMGMLDYEVH